MATYTFYLYQAGFVPGPGDVYIGEVTNPEGVIEKVYKALGTDVYKLTIASGTFFNLGDFAYTIKGNDTAFHEDLIIYGSPGVDGIFSGVDAGHTVTVYGQGGADDFHASGATETFYGGTATYDDITTTVRLDVGYNGDTVSYLNATKGVIVYLGNDRPLGDTRDAGDATGDLYYGIEDVQGSVYSDIIHGLMDNGIHQLIGDPYIAFADAGRWEAGRPKGGDDFLYGGNGYTTFIGGVGADHFFVGANSVRNMIDYESAGPEGVTFNLGGGVGVVNTGDAAGDTYDDLKYSVKNQRHTDIGGSPYGDILHGDDGDNFVYADPDNLLVYAVNGERVGGNDYVYLYGGNDRAWGGPGNDHLYGGSGNDLLGGYVGDDFLYGEDGDDILNGEAGNDTLYGGAGNDTLDGGEGNDILVADSGTDSLNGGSGDDVLYGGTGKNLLTGGSGADVFNYHWAYNSTSANYDIIEDFETGIDTIRAPGFANYLALVRNGNGTIVFSDDDFMLGSANALSPSDFTYFYGTLFQIEDDANGHEIKGSNVRDIIIGKGGGDLIWGYGGADEFRFDAVSHSSLYVPATIMDFVSGVDKLDLRGLNLTAPSANVQWVTDSTGTYVFIDANGDAAYDMKIALNGLGSLSWSDVWV